MAYGIARDQAPLLVTLRFMMGTRYFQGHSRRAEVSYNHARVGPADLVKQSVRLGTKS